MIRVIRVICEICGLKPNHLTYLPFIYIKSHYNEMKNELIKRLHPQF